MKVIVTCGPSIEPIDQVRRLTNFATGELGVLLCNHLLKAGYEPICLKSTTATTGIPLGKTELQNFETNEELNTQLEKLASIHSVAAVFHTAALCDFRVKSAHSASGELIASSKIPTSQGDIHLVLEPARKVIAGLRRLFPQALLVGWKYEMSGTPAEAMQRAQAQLSKNKTDACVLNGAAYGPGFGFMEPGADAPKHLDGKIALCDFLCFWLKQRSQPPVSASR